MRFLVLCGSLWCCAVSCCFRVGLTRASLFEKMVKKLAKIGWVIGEDEDGFPIYTSPKGEVYEDAMQVQGVVRRFCWMTCCTLTCCALHGF